MRVSDLIFLPQKYSESLRDIPGLLRNFRSAWESTMKVGSNKNPSTGDPLLEHIKSAVEFSKGSHASKVKANLLASALPIMIMAREESLPIETEGPVAPELLEGLDLLIQRKYLK